MGYCNPPVHSGRSCSALYILEFHPSVQILIQVIHRVSVFVYNESDLTYGKFGGFIKYLDLRVCTGV